MIWLAVVYFISRIIYFANTSYAYHGQKRWPEVMPAHFYPIHSRYKDMPPFYIPSLQSPIDIRASYTTKVVLPDLEFQNILSNDVLINVKNTGSTVEFEIANKTNCTSRPLLVGGPLMYHGNFEFKNLHVHWSVHDRLGSEHKINSKRYAIEGHCVHFNRKYKTYKEARKYPDGLAVVAFFLKAGKKKNPKLNQVVKLLPNITFPGSIARLTAHNALSWFAEIGRPNGYFTYPGSLTTPPFTENVIWIVYPDPVHISSAQVDAFRRLLSKDLTVLKHNVRPTQPLNRRPLLYSTVDSRLSQVIGT